MEAQQQDHHPTQNAISHEHIQDHDHQANIGATAGVVGINSNTKNMSSGNGYVCSSRQSSTRWTPTTDQIRILKDLYYNNGIRSPTADQIQRISARLRQYGKIEGKNVFYWFQNHKARERQKKRFTNDHIFIPPPPPLPPAAAPLNISFTPIQTSPLPPPHPSNSHHIYNNTHHNHLYPNYLSPAGVSCSSTSCTSPAGVVGQINGSCGNYGSVAMEKSFRDCSISQGETQNCGWVGVDHTNTTTPTYHSFFDKRNPFEQINQETPDDDDHEDQSPEIETLPLFPMHGDIINHDYNGASINGFFKSDQYSSSSAAAGYGFYTGSWFRSDDYAASNAGSRASLELSLNSSYTGWS